MQIKDQIVEQVVKEEETTEEPVASRQVHVQDKNSINHNYTNSPLLFNHSCINKQATQTPQRHPNLYRPLCDPSSLVLNKPVISHQVCLRRSDDSQFSAREIASSDNRKQRRAEKDEEPAAIKLVNEHWNMQTETASKLMSDSTNFVVVGVL